MRRLVIVTGTEAREKLAAGAAKMRDVVGRTLGAWGENVYLDKKDTITNDGFKIAAEVQLEDEVENRGAKAIREAAKNTVEAAGDGTTTSIILAHEIYKAASKSLGTKVSMGSKTSAEIGRQIHAECDEVIEKLKAVATPITSEAELIKSAIVSTEDEELGTLIGKAQWELGPDGVLLPEDSNDKNCSVERVTGLRIDNGFGSSGVVNNQEKWQMEVEDCAVLLTTHTIRDIGHWMELMKVLEPAMRSGIHHIVIVARAWTDETINYCLQNLQKGALKVYPLNAPYENMTERMKDLAAVTGAQFYDSESSELSDMMISGLGKAKRVVGKRMESIIEGPGDEKCRAAVEKRVNELKETRDGAESPFEKKQLSARIAQLEDGFALVKIGSPSNMEKQRLLDKADDAIHAVKAALQEGTIRGAGLEAYEIAQALPDTYVLKRPLMAVYEQIRASSPTPEEFVVADWVRDPVKVWRVALTQAATAAAAFASAGAVITEEFPKRLEQILGKTRGGQVQE